ncbi:hypothetical protein QM467_12605 [Rhodoblastus sp. 17X3]|uniref:hypothetical protein n=1 Tax=Rhodoblastus sp. 17X3 TaxID=3047026 RepID=UPI0024B66C31|nr:hypothetical protein [Rhodoblastus sp. 17X3]MDI9848899.1 hypothetical protein [Rhodoblastus sp. 17X3]
MHLLITKICAPRRSFSPQHRTGIPIPRNFFHDADSLFQKSKFTLSIQKPFICNDSSGGSYSPVRIRNRSGDPVTVPVTQETNMFSRNTKNTSWYSRNIANNVALGLAAFMLFGAQVAVAKTGGKNVNPRAMQAHSEITSQPSRTCVPANGAQILGSFAGADDLIDVNTGEICGKR